MIGNDRCLRYYLSEEAKSAGVRFFPPKERDAGFDLPARENISVAPGDSTLIPTGLHLSIPENRVGIVRDRSSVALRGGMTRAGVIDSSYRGEVKVLMLNVGKDTLTFEAGDRIAQLVVLEHLPGDSAVEVFSLEELGATARQAGGFGSTGK